MSKSVTKKTNRRDRMRVRRHQRVRKKVVGTAKRPRLCVFRSSRHIYVQVIDDEKRETLAAASTLSPDIREQVKETKKFDAAGLVGEAIAKVCLERDIDTIVFDRGGYIYSGGRVRALAAGARKGGLKF